jgi:biotin-(acetyl-CoA carboxylase) ligase
MNHRLQAANGGSKKVTDRWRKLSIKLGHRVTLVFNGGEFAGNCIGIHPQNGLVVQLETGGVKMFDAAHTSTAKPQ